jgi:hypothetical protein
MVLIVKNFQKINSNSFEISKEYNNLLNISNLYPNTFYDISFNDLNLSFMSNENGIIYMNSLPVACIPYNDIRISYGIWNKLKKDMQVPIGTYSDEPFMKWPCKPIYMTLKLTYFDVVNKKIVNTYREVVIKDGSLDLVELPSPEHSYIGIL